MQPIGDGAWVIDLDGVVWLGPTPIPGAADALARLRAAGAPLVFATNNASPTVDELLARLAHAGVEADATELVTSAQAAATLLQPGQSALVCGEGGVVEALAARGVEVRAEPPVDGVVVGWTRRFDFDMVAAAASAVRGGAKLIGANEDPTHPTPTGLLPGTGALLAAVATAAETEPVVGGKPHRPMAELILARAGGAVAIVVGDRPATDGRLAERIGAPYALVRTGVTAPGDPPGDVAAAFDTPDLGALVDRVLAG